MPDFFLTMGPMFWVMLVFAALALAVVAERLFYFHRVNINSGDFLRGLSALLRSGQYDEALHEARQLPGPMARVVEAVLSRPKLARSELRDIAREASELEVYRIERYIRTLLTCAVTLPLLGVLGSILALISFYEQPGITDAGAALPQVADTLISVLSLSAAGLAMAIPAYLFYMYLASRARKIVNNVERAGLECVHIICDARLLSRSSVKTPARGCMAAAPTEEEVSTPEVSR